MKRKLQVFVSSTYVDLPEERQAAVAAILKAGHIPAGMELFAAGDQSQMKTIQRWIDESDVYMLILGGRYGSVEPTSGLSYTELEFDYAVENGKRLFSVVISESELTDRVKNRGLGVVEQDNPRELEQFRAKVLKNISSFFSDAKDIKLAIYESLSDIADDEKLSGWVSAKEIPDAAAFHEEVKILRERSHELESEIARLLQAQAPKEATATDDDLIETLKEIVIKVPEAVSGTGSPEERNLLEILYENQASLINGVENRVGMTDKARFLYFNVFPRLIVHGLAENDGIPGAKYRRSTLNKEGKGLIVAIDRQRARSVKKQAAQHLKA